MHRLFLHLLTTFISVLSGPYPLPPVSRNRNPILSIARIRERLPSSHRGALLKLVITPNLVLVHSQRHCQIRPSFNSSTRSTRWLRQIKNFSRELLLAHSLCQLSRWVHIHIRTSTKLLIYYSDRMNLLTLPLVLLKLMAGLGGQISLYQLTVRKLTLVANLVSSKMFCILSSIMHTTFVFLMSPGLPQQSESPLD